MYVISIHFLFCVLLQTPAAKVEEEESQEKTAQKDDEFGSDGETRWSDDDEEVCVIMYLSIPFVD
jgi:hypothetical protein